MKTICAVQIYLHGSWRTIARFTPMPAKIGLGYSGGGGYLEYDKDYVTEHLMAGASSFLPQVSLNTPIDFLATRHNSWPAFLLDLLPTGAGRQGWLAILGMKDDRAADWTLLMRGARHSVGWLRVVDGDGESEDEPASLSGQVGFTRDEVASREDKFLEYMIERGAAVTGSSDVQGESPKLLLTEDAEGMLHADGALPDNLAKKHWIVKFARKRTDLERQILRNEGAYLRLANELRANVFDPFHVDVHGGRALFIPRFDRYATNGNVHRWGMESFASALGIAEFGVQRQHEECCDLIAKYSASPANDLLEYLRRDILNVCFGNTDNHLRNHAFIKTITRVELSPLYDFAPMFLSDEGYARVIRWDKRFERLAQPNWGAVGAFVAGLVKGPDAVEIAKMYDFIARCLGLIDVLAGEVGIEPEVIERRRKTIEENRILLNKGADEVSGL